MKYKIANINDLNEIAINTWDYFNEIMITGYAKKNIFLKYFINYYKRKFNEKSWICWIAKNDSKIVSHLFLQIIEKVPIPEKVNGRFGYISNFYTKPEFRNKGIGTIMIKNLKKWSKKHYIEKIIVWPSEESESLYDREEFQKGNEIRVFHLSK